MNLGASFVHVQCVCFECLFIVACFQLKKSGKEPKVGAELVVGGTSHKTTVRQTTHSMCPVKNGHMTL